MNTTLREAEFCDPLGQRRRFDIFFVPKRLIRYVQIPTEIDIKKSLEKLFGGYLCFLILQTIYSYTVLPLNNLVSMPSIPFS